MHEVNFKKFIIFNLFYFRFCFGPQVCVGNSSFSICGFVPWRGGVKNIILLHIYTSYFLSTSVTTFLFTPHTIHMRHFGCISVTNRDRPAFVECCSSISTFVIVSSMFFMMGNRESLHDISLLRQRKSN